MDMNITLQTKQMIDNLKAVCTNFGLGNASSEYKIITEVFLYKFLNDKFLFEAKKADKSLEKLSSAEVEEKLSEMSDDDYELFLYSFEPDTAKLKKNHFISYLFNRKNEENFHTLFDETLKDIAEFNIDIFSIRTGGQSKMSLFNGVSQHVIEIEKKDGFCCAIIDKIALKVFLNRSTTSLLRYLNILSKIITRILVSMPNTIHHILLRALLQKSWYLTGQRM